MPMINVKLIEGVFDAAQKQEMIEKLTDTMVGIEGENMRSVMVEPPPLNWFFATVARLLPGTRVCRECREGLSLTVPGMTKTTATHTSRWMKLRKVADMLDVSATTAGRCAETVGFPGASQWVAGGVLRWERHEVEAWMAARTRKPRWTDPSVIAKSQWDVSQLNVHR